MSIKKVNDMETKLLYETPLTEEVRLSAPVLLEVTSTKNNVNEIFYITYGDWEEGE